MNHRLLHITNHQAQSRDVVLRQFQRVDVRKSRYFFDAEDEVYDSSSPLLWVPANSHPQVNPESFKSLIKTQVEEILKESYLESQLFQESQLYHAAPQPVPKRH